MNSPVRFMLRAAVLGICVPWFAHAQFLATPQPGDIFKEFTRVISTSSCNTCVTDPNTQLVSAQANLPNDVLNITISDLQGATRAELVIDHNIGHVGTTGKKVRFNGNAWLTLPELGSGNGIPAGHNGQCYSQQHNPTIQIPLSHLVQGTNYFQGTSAAQTCYDFGWGLWAWYEVLVRVYYGSSKPHPTGSITSPSAGATIGENPTVAATTSAGAAQVDFLAYYDGYDSDGDGVSQEYHYNYHRTKPETAVLMKGHVGSDVTSPFSVTWNTDLVPTQSGIKILARIKGSDGTWFITNPVTGLTLQRSGYVRIYRAYDMPERFWVRAGAGRSPKSVHFNITDNIAHATSVKLVVSTMDADHVAERANYQMKVNNYILPYFGQDHWYSLDALTIPLNQVLQGTNTFTVASTTVHHGIEILWPGPALVVRFSGSPTNSPPSITQHPADQSANVGGTATFTVAATGTSPLSYQWQKNNSNISGATSTSYTTPAVSLSDNGATYRCVVTNNYGNATSNSATLTVTSGNTPPNVTSNPVDQTVQAGATASFAVSATGTSPLAYQWQKNNANIGGATSSNYTTPATVAADSGARFRCIVSNSYGHDTSTAALLRVTTSTGGTNLLANPGFESGTTSWTFYTDGAGSFTSVSPGSEGSKAARIAITTAGANVQLYQNGRTLVNGGTYRITFSAYSSTGHDIAVAMLKQVSPFTTYGLGNTVFNLTTGWQTFTKTFTASGFTGTVTDARLRFWLAPYDANGDVFFIDAVKLERLTLTGIEEVAQQGAFPDAQTEVMPQEFALEQNYPNPFNPSTTISYTVPEPSDVRLSIYNMLGQEVATLINGQQAQGRYSVTWNADDNTGRMLSSGVYVCRMSATAASGKSYQNLMKMVLMK
jgi:hypothetical protein